MCTDAVNFSHDFNISLAKPNILQLRVFINLLSVGVVMIPFVSAVI